MTADVAVAVLGAGTVGSAVARAIAANADEIHATSGVRLRVAGIAARDAGKARDIGGASFTTDAGALVRDKDVDVVVEVIGGMAPALELQLAAFEHGKHVVTANKELVAREWNVLHDAARSAGRELRYEAAVAAAVPVVAAARHLASAGPARVRGLLNGTTTYICSRMEAGATFDRALREAQDAGYAEADPSNDVDGWDAAYKLSILMSILTGTWCDPARVDRTSLRTLTADAIDAARGRDARVRYVASAALQGDAPRSCVRPEEVPAASLEASATGPLNVVTIETRLAGALTFSGAGAGGDATASAIIGDIVAIARSAAR